MKDAPKLVAPSKRLTARTPVKRGSNRITKLEEATVLIDDRAGSRDLIKYHPFDKCGHLARLDSADVSFVGYGADGPVRVGVELKSVTDLISSMDNGRVQATQVRKMVDEYDVVWLLYYGEFRQAPNSNCLQVMKKGEFRNYYLGTRAVPYGMLTGFLISLHEVGVSTMRVHDFREAANWLEELVRWRSKPWDKHKSLRALDESGKVHRATANQRTKHRASLLPTIDERTEQRARIAKQLPALGYERALVVAEKWSVEQMVRATVEEWSELETVDRASGMTKKFGKGVGEAVWRTLRW